MKRTFFAILLCCTVFVAGAFCPVTDSLVGEEKQVKTAELKQRINLEEREEEIKLLNAQNEITEQKLQRHRIAVFVCVVLIFMLLSTVISALAACRSHKRRNILLKARNKRIEEQRSELEKVTQSQRNFISILAHDLKNPFYTVLGYSRILNNEYHRFTDAERKKITGYINQSANSIFRLLQSLLDWSRIRMGKVDYQPRPFAIRELYDEVVQLMKHVASQKNISLTGNIPEDIFVFADSGMIGAVIRNLMDNAIKFSPPGSMVSTSVETPDGRVMVRIRDQGLGMNADELRQLFLIDAKIQRKGTAGEKGSGLGLFLCNEYIRANKGEISAESEPGKGSVFCFTLPGVPVQT